MQETRESQVSSAAEQDDMLVCCLEASELQVIIQPQPAEHLDYHGWSEHEANDHAEPEEIPMLEKLLRQPQVRAHVKHICTHTKNTEHEIQPWVSGEPSGVHAEDLEVWKHSTGSLAGSRNFKKLQRASFHLDQHH